MWPKKCILTGCFYSRPLEDVLDHIHMVHVNDNRGDRDDHLPPGEGDIDWPWILRELQRHRFSGILILELSSRPQESITEMLDRARQAHSYLVNLMLGMDGA